MTKYFRPQKDITAYEVAVIMVHVVIKEAARPMWREPILFSQTQWNGLGEMQRHWADAPHSEYAAMHEAF